MSSVNSVALNCQANVTNDSLRAFESHALEVDTTLKYHDTFGFDILYWSYLVK